MLKAAFNRLPVQYGPLIGPRDGANGLLADKPVADTQHRFKEFRPLRILLQFAPQPVQIDARVMGVLLCGRSPDIAKDLPVRQHLALVGHKEPQQGIFFRRDRYFLAALAHDPAGEINLDRAKPDDANSVIRLGMPQHHAQAGKQLAAIERLCQVIVGSRVHSRKRLRTSTPDMSGRPRSSTTMSGRWKAISLRPTCPLSQSLTAKPPASSVTRSSRRI